MLVWRKWKYRLPACSGLVFSLMSAPFWLGYPGPSVHENLYSILYMAINSFALIAVIGSGLIDPIDRLLSQGQPTGDSSNRITMVLMLVLYIILAYVIGSLLDRRTAHKEAVLSHEEKHY